MHACDDLDCMLNGIACIGMICAEGRGRPSYVPVCIQSNTHVNYVCC